MLTMRNSYRYATKAADYEMLHEKKAQDTRSSCH